MSSFTSFPNREIPAADLVNRIFDFEKDFVGYSKFEIEMGTCSAFFLSEYANSKPDTFFLGIERKRKFLMRGKKNLDRLLEKDNVRIINYDAIAIIKELVPFESLDAIHVYFPDPWYKKKHNRRRTLCVDNMAMFANRLKKGGRLYMATDHADYGEHIRREINGVRHLFNILPYGSDDREIKTKWERKQIAAGFDINYFLLEKK